MIYLKKTIFNIKMLICIEKQLYECCRQQFNNIFPTFHICNEFSDDSIKMFIFSSMINSNKFEAHYKYYYDINSNVSYFYLANYIEEFISRALFCTTIHGSLVQVNDKNILIIGPRKSGKTTLTKFFIEKYNANYLDDDHIYVYNGIYYGFNMPIFLRSPKVLASQYMTFDEEGVCRLPFIPPRKLERVDNVDLILFPHYSVDLEKNIKQLNGVELFNRIINNIRFYNNPISLMHDVAKLSNGSKAYYIDYCCYDWIDEVLE